MTMYTNRPLNGFCCPDGNFENITDIDQPQCTRRCLINQACKVMSYNPTDRVCILGDVACDVAVRQPNYMLMVFRAEFSLDCSVWRPKTNPFSARTVDTRVGNLHEAVSGKQVEVDFLVGHGRPEIPPSSFVRNGREVSYQDVSVLTVNPACTLAWVPYTAESTLPKNALVCGQIAGPTYCAQMWRPDVQRMIYGHYPDGGTAGYYAYYGVKSVAEIDILTRV